MSLLGPPVYPSLTQTDPICLDQVEANRSLLPIPVYFGPTGVGPGLTRSVWGRNGVGRLEDRVGRVEDRVGGT